MNRHPALGHKVSFEHDLFSLAFCFCVTVESGKMHISLSLLLFFIGKPQVLFNDGNGGHEQMWVVEFLAF